MARTTAFRAGILAAAVSVLAGAAHALDLAGSGSVHQIDISALRKRISANLEG